MSSEVTYALWNEHSFPYYTVSTLTEIFHCWKTARPFKAFFLRRYGNFQHPFALLLCYNFMLPHKKIKSASTSVYAEYEACEPLALKQLQPPGFLGTVPQALHTSIGGYSPSHRRGTWCLGTKSLAKTFFHHSLCSPWPHLCLDTSRPSSEHWEQFPDSRQGVETCQTWARQIGMLLKVKGQFWKNT